MSLASLYDVALLDLDGTLYEGADPIPNALPALQKAGLRMMFVTNNASRAPQTVADQLNSLGYECSADDVMTSAQAAIEIARQEVAPGSAVYVLGAQSFKDLATEAGFVVVDSADDAPAAVLHGLNRELTWAQMSEAALAISRGAKYLISNLDTTLPSERGFLVGNGSVAAAITATTGVAPISAGKPLPPMFHVAANKANATKPVAIGDRLDTDIAGGNAAGYDTYMVLTGVSTHLDVLNAPPAFRPTFIGADMRGINGPVEWTKFQPQAGLVARRDPQRPEVALLDGGDPTDPRLADPAQAAVAALQTLASALWPSDGANATEKAVAAAGVAGVVSVEALSDVAKRALEAWEN